MTQGERLAALLKGRPMTYMEMYSTGISVAPHKRLTEWVQRQQGWQIVKGKRYVAPGEYLTTWAVKRA